LEGQNSTLVVGFGKAYNLKDGSGAWKKNSIFILI
jgi:hypothetical protein